MRKSVRFVWIMVDNNLAKEHTYTLTYTHVHPKLYLPKFDKEGYSPSIFAIEAERFSLRSN